MRIVADFHIHSKYARATSPQCDIDGLVEGAKTKGIDLMGTGDFTHPEYFNEIKSRLQGKDENSDGRSADGIHSYKGIKYILSAEVCVIYPEKTGQGEEEKSKKMHHVLLAPSLEVVSQINERLGKYGNLKEDGRPILKMSSAALAEELFSISNEIMIIPGHIWTPWFSVFGSKAGVNTMEEAFENYADRIYAIETGLSSDPGMNWMLSSLDRFTLLSNSDAHSLGKLGREANVFDLEVSESKPLDYKRMTDAIKTRKGFVKTYEFYPEEGKYHYDGHRKCNVLLSPFEAMQKKNICPVCKRKLTIGVMHRIAELADRKLGFTPEKAVPFERIVPLQTVIAKTLKKSDVAIAVGEEYSKIIRYFGNEFAVFEANQEQLRLATTPEIAKSIMRVKEGKIKWIPGYDGVFGELVLDDDAGSSKTKKAVDKKQKSLSDF
ncbi:DNA helicase UvrD [Candidatus Micrarchaeota archaeon]|nr:DNA helicase UvrD [Candidatus Micrarchaeota archaeon]